MDIQTGVICVGVAGMSAIAIFVIFVMFGMKEKTYDEAIAEQRKMPEEHLLLGRSTKDKAKDKKQKKAGKKVKEKPRDEREKNIHADSKTTTTHEKTHVEFEEPEAEFINDRPPQEESRKKKKKDKLKPILLNKDEHTPVVEAPSLSSVNHFEERHPMDDLLLKRQESKEDVSVKLINDLEDQSETLSAANNLKHVKHVKASSGKGEKLVGNKLSKLSGAKGEKEAIPPKQDKSSVVAAPKQEKSSVVAAPKQEKSSVVAAPKQEKSSVGAAPKQEKSSVVAAPKQEKSSVVAAPKQEKSSVLVAAPSTLKLEDEEGSAVCLIKADKNNSPKVEKATVKVEKLIMEHGTPPLSSKERSKKKRSELATLHQMSGDRDGVNVSLLVPLVRKAELSRSEVQILIDLLLNKQQGPNDEHSEWYEGRQDPVVKLKKQLAEKEKALAEEQEAAQAVQSKLRELRSELNSERSRLTQMCRQLEEGLAAKTSEVQTLITRLQLATEAASAEKQALVQQGQQLQSKYNEEHILLCQLQEKDQTQGVFQQEILAQRQQLELHIARLSEAEGAYKAQVGQLQAQLHEQLNVNASLAVQLRDAQLERDGITQQLAHMQEVAVRAEEITRQLEESNHARSEVEHQLTALQHHDYEKTKEIQAERLRLGSDLEQLQAQVQRLREDNEHLTHQVSSLSGLEDEVSQLREENESLAAQVTAVTERPAAEGRENGDLNYPEEDKAAFINHDTVVKQKDSLIESLTSELNIHKTETSKLSEELEVQREKNNALRTKNWKAMEALSTTEKSLETKVKQIEKLVSEATERVRLEEQTITKTLLQRIFPEVIVEDVKTFDQWLEIFESRACILLSDLKSRLVQVDNTALEAENAKLEALVAHYKTIIEETEGMLNRLQNHVEKEEARWKQLLEVKETALQTLREEKERLEGSHEATCEVCGVEFAYSCIEKSLPHIVTEMQSQLKALEGKLRTEEGEKQELAAKYESLSQCWNERQDKLGRGQDLLATLERVQEERNRLSADLQAEHERSESLSKEVTELRSVLQDVEQLDKSVTQNHSSSVNGPASEPSITESLSTLTQPMFDSALPDKRGKNKKKKGGSGKK